MATRTIPFIGLKVPTETNVTSGRNTPGLFNALNWRFTESDMQQDVGK